MPWTDLGQPSNRVPSSSSSYIASFHARVYVREKRIYIVPGMNEISVERTLSSNYRISSLVPFSLLSLLI